jgi:hypothetical protein
MIYSIQMFEMFYVFNSRYLHHSVLNLHGLFGTVDLDAHTWQVIVAVASSVFILVEIEKFFIRLFLPKAAAGNGMK